jgi:hypothetical protein
MNSHFARHVVFYGMLFTLLANAFIDQFNGHVSPALISALKYLITCVAITVPYLNKQRSDDDAPAAPAAPAAGPAIVPAAAKAAVMLIFAGIVLGGMSGCSTTGQTIDAATTTLKVKDSTGKSFAVGFPKELNADTFVLDVDPSTGHVKVSANKIQTSSSQIIENAGNASAQATLAMAQAFQALAPAVAQAVQAAGAATSVAVPAAAPAIAAAKVAASALPPPQPPPAAPKAEPLPPPEPPTK